MADQTLHPGFREKVHASFARQGLMKTLGGRLTRVDPGRVEIELPYSEAVTQQHGYFHAAAVAAIADNAGGYAALTLMNPDEEVVAAEFKVNLLRPAVGPRLVAEATVLRAGRVLIVSQITVSGFVSDARVPVAVMIQTNCRVRDGGTVEHQGAPEGPPLRSAQGGSDHLRSLSYGGPP